MKSMVKRNMHKKRLLSRAEGKMLDKIYHEKCQAEMEGKR